MVVLLNGAAAEHSKRAQAERELRRINFGKGETSGTKPIRKNKAVLKTSVLNQASPRGPDLTQRAEAGFVRQLRDRYNPAEAAETSGQESGIGGRGTS
jgi:hypothetical protein